MDGFPELVLLGVQPTVPADFDVPSPSLRDDVSAARTEPLTLTWTPAQTYLAGGWLSIWVDGVLASTEKPGSVAVLPWDDGEYTLPATALGALHAGEVRLRAESSVQGKPMSLPGSKYSWTPSSTVTTTGTLTLE